MKATLESTDRLTTVTVKGQTVPARVWQGTTESGVPVIAYIAKIGAPADADHSEFERELIDGGHTELRPELQAYDLRLFLD
jgi:hypothetical protein